MKKSHIFFVLLAAAGFLYSLNAVSTTTASAGAKTDSAPVAEKTPPPKTAKKSGAGKAAKSISTAAAPEVVVADLYKQHAADKSPFFQTENRALVDKYFSRSIADMIWNDAVTSDGEVGVLGADPLYDAQDTEIKNFKIGKGEIKGSAAVVKVTFSNFGEERSIDFELVREKGVWKIENIKYGEYTLLELFQNNMSDDSDDDNR